MKAPLKKRLDTVVVERYPELTRAQAASWIIRGAVTVNGILATKPGTLVKSGDEVLLCITTPRYVSRAGYKLEKALEYFAIDVTGKIALDSGISTGGFTDCLLQRGVARVYGVDVCGAHLVHESIRMNPRVVLFEKTNLRYLDGLPELVDLVTLDLSFISVEKVLPVVIRCMGSFAELILLIKPQFEAGRSEVGRKGIVSDTAVHERVIASITALVAAAGFTVVGYIPSPLLGATGNQEFLLYARLSRE